MPTRADHEADRPGAGRGDHRAHAGRRCRPRCRATAADRPSITIAIEKTMPIEVRLASKFLTSDGLVDAGRVDLADAEVDGERGRRDQPAVVARWGDRVLAVECGERHGCLLGARECAVGHGARCRAVETSTFFSAARPAGTSTRSGPRPARTARAGRPPGAAPPAVRCGRRPPARPPGPAPAARRVRSVPSWVRSMPSAWHSRAGPRARSRSPLPRRSRARSRPSTTSPARSSTADAEPSGPTTTLQQ